MCYGNFLVGLISVSLQDSTQRPEHKHYLVLLRVTHIWDSGPSGSCNTKICSVVTKLPEKQNKDCRHLGSCSVHKQGLSGSLFTVWIYYGKLHLENLNHEVWK